MIWGIFSLLKAYLSTFKTVLVWSEDDHLDIFDGGDGMGPTKNVIWTIPSNGAFTRQSMKYMGSGPFARDELSGNYGEMNYFWLHSSTRLAM